MEPQYNFFCENVILVILAKHILAHETPLHYNLFAKIDKKLQYWPNSAVQASCPDITFLHLSQFSYIRAIFVPLHSYTRALSTAAACATK